MRPPRQARAGPGPDEARPVRLGRAGTAAHQAMLHTIEAWAQASMGTRPGDAAHPRRGRGPVRLRRGRAACAPDWMQNFDEADLYGMQALAYRTLAEHDPAAATRAQAHAPSKAMAAADRGPRAVDDLRLPVAGLGLLHRRRPRTGGHATRRLALLPDRARPPRARTWDRLREMYRLSGRYAGYAARSRTCGEEIEATTPCRKGRSGATMTGGRGRAAASHPCDSSTGVLHGDSPRCHGRHPGHQPYAVLCGPRRRRSPPGSRGQRAGCRPARHSGHGLGRPQRAEFRGRRLRVRPVCRSSRSPGASCSLARV